MKIVIIDGQGGGIGKGIVERLRSLRLTDAQLIAVGTNAAATSAMLHAGADAGATGRDALVYTCMQADIIMGPIGILLAHAMLGEISPEMACAVSGSRAVKLLIPVSRCGVRIMGVEDLPLAVYIDRAAAAAAQIVRGGAGGCLNGVIQNP